MEKFTASCQQGETLREVMNRSNVSNALCAKIDNRMRELCFVFKETGTHEITPLDFTDTEACKIYDASLRFLVGMASYRVFPNLRLIISYGVSKSMFLTFEDKETGKVVPADTSMRTKLEKEMKAIIAADCPITKAVISKEEAIKIYNQEGFNDKTAAFKYRPEDTVHIYECDGYYDYPYSYMVDHTGMLSHFRLMFVNPGLVLSYPRAEDGGKISPLDSDPSFGKALKRYSDWAKTAGLFTISDINTVLADYGPTNLIEMCESYCNDQMQRLGALYRNRTKDCRLILISGPSSSGKTTFARKLKSYLMSYGLRPIRISMDDYYRNRSLLPVGPDGKKDVEGIGAIDLERFSADMLSLAQGKPTEVPAFDFVKQERVKGRLLTPKPGSPIIVEGIHGLNPKITGFLPRKLWLGIYISPQVQVAIDDHNPMSLTDARLIRRIVRDNLFRGTAAETTIENWPDVRKGEYDNIYPNQENADFVFNSYLSYELCVLKKHAIPALKGVNENSPSYIVANRLLKFLKHFQDIPDELVPCNSLLKEFIGGSSYQ